LEGIRLYFPYQCTPKTHESVTVILVLGNFLVYKKNGLLLLEMLLMAVQKNGYGERRGAEEEAERGFHCRGGIRRKSGGRV
jgi:hypothetical protein